MTKTEQALKFQRRREYPIAKDSKEKSRSLKCLVTKTGQTIQHLLANGTVVYVRIKDNTPIFWVPKKSEFTGQGETLVQDFDIVKHVIGVDFAKGESSTAKVEVEQNADGSYEYKTLEYLSDES